MKVCGVANLFILHRFVYFCIFHEVYFIYIWYNYNYMIHIFIHILQHIYKWLNLNIITNMHMNIVSTQMCLSLLSFFAFHADTTCNHLWSVSRWEVTHNSLACGNIHGVSFIIVDEVMLCALWVYNYLDRISLGSEH